MLIYSKYIADENVKPDPVFSFECKTRTGFYIILNVRLELGITFLPLEISKNPSSVQMVVSSQKSKPTVNNGKWVWWYIIYSIPL